MNAIYNSPFTSLVPSGRVGAGPVSWERKVSYWPEVHECTDRFAQHD